MAGIRLELMDGLTRLVELEIDGVLAYQQALSWIRMPAARDVLAEIQRAHQSQLAEMNVVVQELGGTPPATTREFRGYRSEGLSAPAAGATDVQNLRALRANEKLSERLYAETLALARPGPIQDLLRRGHESSTTHRRELERLGAA